MTVPWLAVRVFFVFGVIVTLAWPQRRDVQAGFKIPFAIFLLEASGREKRSDLSTTDDTATGRNACPEHYKR